MSCQEVVRGWIESFDASVPPSSCHPPGVVSGPCATEVAWAQSPPSGDIYCPPPPNLSNGSWPIFAPQGSKQHGFVRCQSRASWCGIQKINMRGNGERLTVCIACAQLFFPPRRPCGPFNNSGSLAAFCDHECCPNLRISTFVSDRHSIPVASLVVLCGQIRLHKRVQRFPCPSLFVKSFHCN